MNCGISGGVIVLRLSVRCEYLMSRRIMLYLSTFHVLFEFGDTLRHHDENIQPLPNSFFWLFDVCNDWVCTEIVVLLDYNQLWTNNELYLL